MQYKLKTPKFIENTVVRAHRAVERGVVGVYKSIENAFVSAFLEKTQEHTDIDDSPEAQTKP